ncbi:L-alanine-DL-glutamate epimerase [Candidatus Sumerlaea chitinivorans]|uniref:Dipeptide epimerase n=1 Tax=Sumerlaea chitinivorans TaxID=2250252 RepID=A0A2Z4Y8G4_SUMC1|nr:L-alanine-DL-glutamate epimerase [Candidatus Sumerlaea chitinivorans]
MSPLHLTTARYVLKLVDPFGISRITRTEEERIYLALDGGIGEAAPVSYYGEDEETVTRTLATVEQMEFDDLDLVEHVMTEINARVPENRAAKAALDMALYDRLGKRLGIPLWKLFGHKPTRPLLTSFTIGIDTLEVMLEKVERAQNYKILKIKLGRDVEHDLTVMREIRKLVGPEKCLRVDANAGWDLDTAKRAFPVLADLGVEFVEQPLPMGAFEQLPKLKSHCPLPILLDEDVHTARDIPRLAPFTDGINIKLMKSGGLAEARRMIAVARAHGLRVMLGCMIESSLGITAAAHLGPAVDYLDLDGHLLIANDPFAGVACDPDGTMHLPTGPGLGVTVLPEYREALLPVSKAAVG